MGRPLLPLLALLVLSAVVHAQVPQPEPSGVSVRPAHVDVEASVEGPTEFEVRVEHTGGSGLPVPGAQERRFRVAAVDVPEGWVAHADPADFALGPGESQSVVVVVQVAAQAPRSADFEIVAQLVPQGVQDVPGVGPLADPESEARTTVSAVREESFTRDLLERIGPGVYVLLLAVLAALVLVGAVLVQRRRGAVHLDAPQPQVVLGPGGRGSVRLLVENSGRQDDSMVFHVSDVDPGWAAFLPVPELRVRADHAEELQLVVIAPADAPPGARQSVQVQATASRQAGRPASVTVEAVVGPMSGGDASPSGGP